MELSDADREMLRAAQQAAEDRMACSRRRPKPSPMQRMSHSKWRAVLDAFEASGYTAEMSDELFEALGQCRGDHPRLAPYLREIEQRAAIERQRREAQGNGWMEPPVETRVVPDPVMGGGSIE